MNYYDAAMWKLIEFGEGLTSLSDRLWFVSRTRNAVNAYWENNHMAGNPVRMAILARWARYLDDYLDVMRISGA